MMNKIWWLNFASILLAYLGSLKSANGDNDIRSRIGMTKKIMLNLERQRNKQTDRIERRLIEKDRLSKIVDLPSGVTSQLD